MTVAEPIVKLTLTEARFIRDTLDVDDPFRRGQAFESVCRAIELTLRSEKTDG